MVYTLLSEQILLIFNDQVFVSDAKIQSA